MSLLLALACAVRETFTDAPSNIEDTALTVTEPIPQATGLTGPTSTFEVAGELRSIFPSGANRESSYALSILNNEYVLSDASQDIELASLPTERDYSFTQTVSIDGQDFILAPYLSNSGFTGQDGSKQGYLLTDLEGNIINDFDLTQLGQAGITAVTIDQDTNALFLLCNNLTNVDSAYDNVDYGTATLVKIYDPFQDSANLNTRDYEIYSLPGFNPGAMSWLNGKLLIASAGETLTSQAEAGQVLVVDPDSGIMENPNHSLEIEAGVGLNGSAPTQNDSVIFTGNNENHDSIVVATQDDVQSIRVPNIYQTYVSNVVPVGTSYFFNSNGIGEITSVLLREDGSAEELNTVSANYEVSPIVLGDDSVCTGASGTRIDDNGLVYSSIYCYTPTY